MSHPPKDPVSHAWQTSLASALKDWCLKNGYKQFNRLGRELDIPESSWKRLTAGDGILSENEIYARLFKRTGLSQTDPREIPPRLIKLPKGDSMEKNRAWNATDYAEWDESEGHKYAPRREEMQHPSPAVAAQAPSASDLLEAMSPDSLHQETSSQQADAPRDVSQSQGPMARFGSMLDALIAPTMSAYVGVNQEQLNRIEQSLRVLTQAVRVSGHRQSFDVTQLTGLHSQLAKLLQGVQELQDVVTRPSSRGEESLNLERMIREIHGEIVKRSSEGKDRGKTSSGLSVEALTSYLTLALKADLKDHGVEGTYQRYQGRFADLFTLLSLLTQDDPKKRQEAFRVLEVNP